MISIHVPREGNDVLYQRRTHSLPEFQSTSPARGTTEVLVIWSFPCLFQSTSPARGTTPCSSWLYCGTVFQSTSPAMGTTIKRPVYVIPAMISIHVPREGNDLQDGQQATEAVLFQSTSPARGTTTNNVLIYSRFDISIHVPREGNDRMQQAIFLCLEDFNPRPPRGERQWPPLQALLY